MLLYLVFSASMLACALGLDARQFELVAEHLGQFVERNLDFEKVAAARLAAGAARCRLALARLADRVADVAVALARRRRSRSCRTGTAARRAAAPEC